MNEGSDKARDADWSLTWPAPAKLNLFLHVVGRRDDGYHLLQSVFRLVDLADSLRFAPRNDGRIALAALLEGVPEERDLCVRAANLLREAAARRGVATCGVTISLEKRIPMGGGLGGGSSDAATVLLALNRLWRIGLGRAELQALGLKLGADVPFFLCGFNAFAEGVGEALTPLELLPAWYLLLVPPVQVPTAAVFAAPELTRNTKSVKISSFSGKSSGGLDVFEGGKLGVEFGHNDLQPVVCARYPEVARSLDWLAQYGRARMSGSGACVFAQFDDRAEAEAVLSRLPLDMRGMVVRGLERHPIDAG
jgi:4-diphosphocytidyl-2-C-methyl-D-erythritol kinase